MTISIEKLEKTFRNIQISRMKGVPVINNELSVKAIHFQEWNDHLLGILITPWFMNLMLIPNGKTDAIPKTGTVHQHVFPSGSYDFVAGFEEEVGHYLSCSLFSPMFEFESQESAELTANEAIKAIMNEDNIDNASQNPAQEIEKMWNGKIPPPEKTHNFDGSKIETKVEKKEPRRKLSERLKEPTSRRDFLRGKAFREESTVPTDSNQA